MNIYLRYPVLLTFIILFITYNTNAQGADCSSAQAITANATCANTAFSVSGSYSGIIASCASGSNNDGWYEFVAIGTTTNIDASANKDLVLAVFSDCAGTELGSGCASVSGTTASIIVATIIGDTYYIQLHRQGGGGGSMTGNVCVYGLAGGGVQNAMDFDGANDYISSSNASALVTGGSISLTMWVYLTNPAAGWPDFDGLAGLRNNSNCDFYILQLSSTSFEARFRNSTGTNYTINTGSGVLLNTWMHLAFVYDGSNLMFYINGTMVNTMAASGSITNSIVEFTAGKTNYSTNFWLDGQLDEVSLWNKGLTAAEVNCIYTEGILLPQGNLVLYYKYDQGIGNGNNTLITTVDDSAIPGITGVINSLAMNGTTSNFVPSPITFTPCLVLPISLGSFDATCDNDHVVLNWVTESEVNNDYFTIETSSDGINFESRAILPAAGNSTSTINYSWMDESVSSRTTFYRLKQTDYNGDTEVFDIVSANCGKTQEIQIYPNPFEDRIVISTQLSGSVQIIDVMGQILSEEYIHAGKTEVNTTFVSSGTYFLKITLSNGDHSTFKVTKM